MDEQTLLPRQIKLLKKINKKKCIDMELLKNQKSDCDILCNKFVYCKYKSEMIKDKSLPTGFYSKPISISITDKGKIFLISLRKKQLSFLIPMIISYLLSIASLIISILK